jgi:hypothetical protein
LVEITTFQSAAVIFLNVMSRVMPALFTSTSTGPTSRVTVSTHALQESKSDTSHAYALNP